MCHTSLQPECSAAKCAFIQQTPIISQGVIITIEPPGYILDFLTLNVSSYAVSRAHGNEKIKSYSYPSLCVYMCVECVCDYEFFFFFLFFSPSFLLYNSFERF